MSVGGFFPLSASDLSVFSVLRASRVLSVPAPVPAGVRTVSVAPATMFAILGFVLLNHFNLTRWTGQASSFPSPTPPSKKIALPSTDLPDSLFPDAIPVGWTHVTRARRTRFRFILPRATNVGRHVPPSGGCWFPAVREPDAVGLSEDVVDVDASKRVDRIRKSHVCRSGQSSIT